MPRQEYVIRIFVSSPADVSDERQILEDLVRELNIAWSDALGLRLELQRWETSVLPGLGTEPQAVVDTAIADDYDAFIGILWKRFGTPTSLYRSGTEHEFERAFARARSEPSLRVMFYFSDKPVPPSELDPQQLASVQSFRESLGPRGVLWMSYNDPEDFRQLLRLHLSRLAQEWQARLPGSGTYSPPPTVPKEPELTQPLTDADDEDGLLDLAELLQVDIAALTQTAERIGQAIQDVGQQMNAGSAAVTLLVQAGETQPARIKRVINRAAEDVDLFASRIEAELPILATVYERVVTNFGRAAILQASLPGVENPLPGVIEAATTLVANTRTAKEGAESMRAAAAAWPRMSTALNRAKRRVLDTLDRLTAEFQRNIDITEEIIRNLRKQLV